MATANTKSTQVTNADAAVQTLNSSAIAEGTRRGALATLEVAAADDDTSVYRFVRVHSSWRITSIRVYCDAITSGTSYDCGLYQTSANGGAVVDSDAYASAVDLSSAITTGTQIAFEARNISTIGQTVWQDAGLSADPGR